MITWQNALIGAVMGSYAPNQGIQHGFLRGARPMENDRLLTPGEVAALFRVDPKTVTRWAASGRIGSIRTPGGHRRFRESEVRALLQGELGDASPLEQEQE